MSFLSKLKAFDLSRFTSKLRTSRRDSDMASSTEVLVFGSANIDYITYVEHLPDRGETICAMHREQCFGGKGANQCVAAAKLGANCALVANLGNDQLGNDYYNYLNQLDVDVTYVQLKEECSTGMAEVVVADNADNHVIVVGGANNLLNAKDVTRSRSMFRHARVLLCQLETDERAVLFALKQFKGISVLNASPARKDLPIELIKAPHILCINELEAAQLTNRPEIVSLYDAKAAAQQLLRMGAKSVIITMGAQGAVHLSKQQPDNCTHVPAAHVRYLADTSGAGDAFLGALAFHLSRFPNLRRESHIQAANICAAYAVGHRGTQPSFPGPELAQHSLCSMPLIYSVIPDAPPEPEPEPEPAPAPVVADAVDAAPVAGAAAAGAAGAAAVAAEPAAEAAQPAEAAAEPQVEPEAKAAPEPEPVPETEPEPVAQAAVEPELQAKEPEPEAKEPEPEAKEPEPEANEPEPQAKEPEPQAMEPEADAQKSESEAKEPEPEATPKRDSKNDTRRPSAQQRAAEAAAI
ncbi:CG17010 [Drosophila busckii]|uniref:Ribokinase n=1 Tax=Drosophila busckii TaxID=30019 RepID=A0A0M4E6V1_DROBS|nr:CG17010 [Drosophila busckii]